LVVNELKDGIAANDVKISAIEQGSDDTWLLIGGVVVFLMQAGFALLESGAVRFKNFQNVLLKNCMDACMGGIVWWATGFAFAFGDVAESGGGIIGVKYFFGVGAAEAYTAWFFQFAFACTAATITSGSLAERV